MEVFIRRKDKKRDLPSSWLWRHHSGVAAGCGSEFYSSRRNRAHAMPAHVPFGMRSKHARQYNSQEPRDIENLTKLVFVIFREGSGHGSSYLWNKALPSAWTMSEKDSSFIHRDLGTSCSKLLSNIATKLSTKDASFLAKVMQLNPDREPRGMSNFEWWQKVY